MAHAPHHPKHQKTGFDWDSHKFGEASHYAQLLERVGEIVDGGVTHMWLPPPSNSVSPEGYLPGQLYNLNSAYGTRQELEALLAALTAGGVVPIADIVINHRCADHKDDDGLYTNYQDDYDHEGHRIDW